MDRQIDQSFWVHNKKSYMIECVRQLKIYMIECVRQLKIYYELFQCNIQFEKKVRHSSGSSKRIEENWDKTLITLSFSWPHESVQTNNFELLLYLHFYVIYSTLTVV